jgi:Phospholipase_D-nuclease N-terminal
MVVIAASTAVWIFILVPLAIVWAAGVYDIVRSHRSGWTTVGWLLVVILVPVVGSIVYWTLRKPTEKDIRRAQAAAAERPRNRQPGAGL